MSRRILRLPAVLPKTGDSKSTIRRKELAGQFPRRVQTGPNSVGWFEDEVDAYLQALPRKQLQDSHLPPVRPVADDEEELEPDVLMARPARRGRRRRRDQTLELATGQT